MKTVEKMKNLFGVPDDILSALTTLPSVDIINEGIVGLVITEIQSDRDGLQLCDVMEVLVDCEPSRLEIEALKKGNYVV